MNVPPGESCLQLTQIGYRQILLKKLSYAVTSSVFSQILILLLYLFIINFDILHPLDWMVSPFKLFTSINTWLFVILFLSIIFAQCILCAKDYIFKSTYCSTRIRKFISVFSLRNLVLLLLHIISGVLGVWLLLSLSNGNYSSLYVKCKFDYCLSDGMLYLLSSGLWSGFYYFLRIYSNNERIKFPVVPQRKLLKFKVKLLILLKTSYKSAVWPCVYFMVLYYIWGSGLKAKIASFLKVPPQSDDTNIFLYFYVFLYIGLFFFNMNLMRYFFELFLTEPMIFPIVNPFNEFATLSEALNANSIPIIQHLACSDLYALTNSKERRAVLFTLSQPGGHPHNWNKLLQNVLQLINEFIQNLNKSTTVTPEKVVPLPSYVNVSTNIQSPIQSPNYSRIRNMSCLSDYNSPQICNITYPKISPVSKLTQKLNDLIHNIKEKSGINYLFGDLPEANIQRCLSDGQVIIWSVQGLAYLTAASIQEDRFGIVQKDLVIVISTLVELKIAIDKLNRVPALCGKGPKYYDFNYKMKISVNNAVKRCLYHICYAFRVYIKDLPLKKETAQYLQNYINK